MKADTNLMHTIGQFSATGAQYSKSLRCHWSWKIKVLGFQILGPLDQTFQKNWSFQKLLVLLNIDASSLPIEQRVCAVSTASSFSGITSIATIQYRYCVSLLTI